MPNEVNLKPNKFRLEAGILLKLIFSFEVDELGR